MQSTIIKQHKSEVELHVEVDPEEFDRCMDTAVAELSKNLTIDGFRAGKAPRSVVENNVGAEKLFAEAANIAVRKYFPQAAQKHSLEIIASPKVEVRKLAPGNPFSFKATAAIVPEVTLPDYKNISSESKRKQVSVSEQELEDAVQWLRKSRAQLSQKAAAAEKGDFVQIEYWSEGPTNHIPIQKDSFILGDGRLTPPLEDELVGMKAGESKEHIQMQLPKGEQQQELAGKTIQLTLKLHSVQLVKLPELSDEFARSVGTFHSMQELRDSIKKSMTYEKEQEEIKRVSNEILTKIAAKTTCDIPNVLIDREQLRLADDIKKQVDLKLHVSLAEYAQKMGKSEQELIDSLREEASRRIKQSLILKSIAEQEHIEASESEIQDRQQAIIKQYPDPKQAQKDFEPEQLSLYAAEVTRNEKVLKMLADLAK